MSREPSPVGDFGEDDTAELAARDPGVRVELERLARYEAIARAVLRLRMTHDLSREDLAARIQASVEVVEAVEDGQGPTELDLLGRIADAFGVDLRVEFVPRRPVPAEMAARSAR